METILIIGVICAFTGMAVADSGNKMVGFLLGFLLGIIGILIVVFGINEQPKHFNAIQYGIQSYWYHDPYEKYLYRFWDGYKWTCHVIDTNGIQAIDPSF